MKKQFKSPTNLLFTVLAFLTIVAIVSCQRSDDFLDSIGSSDKLETTEEVTTAASLPCLESYDQWGWFVTYRCPQNPVELWVSNNDYRRAKRIDSIIKANPVTYQVTQPQFTDPKKDPSPERWINIHRYGKPTISMIDEIASAPEHGATVTLYVMEYGPYGGYLAIGVTAPGYSRTVSFYPNSNPIKDFVGYPGVFFDTSGLAYTYSISKSATFLAPFLTSLTKRTTPGIQHSFRLESFEGYHLFKEACDSFGLGLSLPNINPLGGESYAYKLASAIRTWTPPSNVTVNREGGITPARQGTGGSIVE